jgi:hypothetical protein
VLTLVGAGCDRSTASGHRADIADDPSKKLIKNVRRFPERRVLQFRQAMASRFPQIPIFRNLQTIEVDRRIPRVVHHGQGHDKIARARHLFSVA